MQFIWEQALITVDHPDQYQDLCMKEFCNAKGLAVAITDLTRWR